MNEEENLDAIVCEFMDKEEAIQHQIEAEWEERYRHGEKNPRGRSKQIRVLALARRAGLRVVRDPPAQGLDRRGGRGGRG